MFEWIHKCFSAIIFQIQTQFSASFVDLLRLLTLRLNKYVFHWFQFSQMSRNCKTDFKILSLRINFVIY